MSKSNTFSLDLSSGKIRESAPGLAEYIGTLPGNSNADKMIGLWQQFNSARTELDKLRQVSGAGGAFMELIGDEDKPLVRESFMDAAGNLDLLKLAGAVVAVARREATQRSKKGELGTVQTRLEAVLQAIIDLNNSIPADKWFLREMVNSKSLSVAAGSNIPSTQEFIAANQERIAAHNATLRNGEPVGDYFNRQAKTAAKKTEVFTAKRVRAEKNEAGEWAIKQVEERM